MAQNDWYFSYRNQSGDAQGIAIFHDSLSNPLTNEEHGVGTYCRRFGHVNINGYSTTSAFSLLTKNTNFVNVPDTKAISVRAWMRKDQPGGRGGNHGIMVKATAVTNNPGGYYLYMNSNNAGYLDGTHFSLPSGFAFEHNWHHLRLDVIPIKHNGVVIMDHLKGYLEVNGEWTLMVEKYIESTDSNFVSWDGNRYNGLKSYYNSHYETSTNWLYVDKVEMYLEDVEQPERPVISLQNDTGPSDQDNITSDPSIVVSQPEVGATLSYSTDTVNWQSTVPAAVSGSNTLYVRQVSAEGRTSPPGQLTFTYVPAAAAPIFTSLTASSIAENGGENQVVYTAAATSDLTDVIYSLKEVGDYQDFSIGLNNGQVTTLANLDYETKNAYSFTTIATDLAGHAVEQDVSLSVTDANEEPSFALALALGTEANPLSEDAALDTVVGSLSFSDPEGDSVTFSIDTQTVAGTFAISGSSLVLTSSLDYEVASEHTVQISANDGVNTVNQSYVVKIGDVNEAPTFSLSLSAGTSGSPLAENTSAGTVIGTLSGTDPESQALTFSIVSQDVTDMFEISGSDLKVLGSLDYESNSSHSLTLRASEGVNDVDQSYTIYISDVNEAPTNLQASTLTMDDGLGAGTVVLTLSATDEDSGDTLAYSLVSGDGSTDNAKFEVSGSSLKILEATDSQVSASYSVRVAATDAGGLSVQAPLVLEVSSSS
jgi:hypothetical protein